MNESTKKKLIDQVESVLADKQLSGYVTARDVFFCMKANHDIVLSEDEIENELKQIPWLVAGADNRYYRAE